MKGKTISNEAVTDCRKEHSRLAKVVDGLTAVIVNIEGAGLGVQYWTAEQMEAGEYQSSSALATFIEKL